MEKISGNFSKHKKAFSLLMIILLIIGSCPSPVEAHRAYFMQILIDEGQKVYVSNIILDKSVIEKEKTEAKIWKYDNSQGTTYKNYDGNTSGTDSMAFTFPPKPYKHWKFLASKNNATSKDANRAYTIADTLVANTNEILLIMNGSKQFETVEDMIAMSEELVAIYKNGGSKNNVSYSPGSNTMTVSAGGKDYELLVKMAKGYKESTLEDGKASNLYKSNFNFSDDIGDLSIADIIVQGNYMLDVKGSTSSQADEYSNPGTLEIKASEFFSSIMYSLRSLLGLRDISEVIYNEGITGSSMYYGGIMPKTWMDNAMKFHMLFQSLTWVALSVAIIKLLLQRNLATINPASRISLMEGIKDLLIAGFMLISIFVLINIGIDINEKIVSVFGATAPDYNGWSGGDLQFASFAGVMLEIYYLIITIYLNVIYIIRAISTALLIASAPLFIASIAFQEKNKSIFETWIKELVSNIFMQSFHAFSLSFLLSVQMTSVRGIELAVVSFSLIPMTKFFRSLITGNSGGFSESLGMAGVTMAGGAVGGLASGIAGTAKEKVRGRHDGESNIKTKNSDDIRNAGKERREHSGSTPTESASNEAFVKMQNPFNKEEGLTSDSSYSNSSGGGNLSSGASVITPGEGSSGNFSGEASVITSGEANDDIIDAKINESTPYESFSNKRFKDLGKFDGVGTAKTVGRSFASAGTGAAQLTAGAAIAMALGGEGRLGADIMRRGAGNIGGATRDMSGLALQGAKGVGKRFVNEFGPEGGNILGMEENSNGNIVVHRDRELVERGGFSDIKKTSDENIAVTYNASNLSEENRGYLKKIEDAYGEGKTEYLEQRGVQHVNKDGNGNTVVHYNKHGQEQMGIKDAYSSNNRVVETKNPGQKLGTDYIYDIGGTPAQPKSDNYKEGETYVEPDGGNSYYSNALSLDDIID